MQGRKRWLMLVGASLILAAGSGTALAEPPGGHGYRGSGGHQGLHQGKRHVTRGRVTTHRGHQVRRKSHARRQFVRHHRPRHFSRGHYHRAARRHHFAYGYPAAYRHGRLHYHRRHRHVDVGAVVAGLILGGLVYEILDDDSGDDYYEYRYDDDSSND